MHLDGSTTMALEAVCPAPMHRVSNAFALCSLTNRRKRCNERGCIVGVECGSRARAICGLSSDLSWRRRSKRWRRACTTTRSRGTQSCTMCLSEWGCEVGAVKSEQRAANLPLCTPCPDTHTQAGAHVLACVHHARRMVCVCAATHRALNLKLAASWKVCAVRGKRSHRMPSMHSGAHHLACKFSA